MQSFHIGINILLPEKNIFGKFSQRCSPVKNQDESKICAILQFIIHYKIHHYKITKTQLRHNQVG